MDPIQYLNATEHYFVCDTSELRHDKTNKVSVRPAKTQISLGWSAQSDQSLRCPHEESWGP